MLVNATAADAPAIAALHALSWQKTYRGAMTDDYLDHEAPADRLRVWTERFAANAANMQVTVSKNKNDQLEGFACVFASHSPADGHLLDNLHVHPTGHGKGLGKCLMQHAAQRLLDTGHRGELYLWVLTANLPAIGFYERMGGRPGRVEMQDFVGGQRVEAIMMSWPLEALVNSAPVK